MIFKSQSQGRENITPNELVQHRSNKGESLKHQHHEVRGKQSVVHWVLYTHRNKENVYPLLPFPLKSHYIMRTKPKTPIPQLRLKKE